MSQNKIVSLGLKTDFRCSPSLSHLDSLQPRSSGLQYHFWPHTSPPLVTSPLRQPFLPHHLATLRPLPSPFGNSPDNYLLFKVFVHPSNLYLLISFARKERLAFIYPLPEQIVGLFLVQTIRVHFSMIL